MFLQVLKFQNGHAHTGSQPSSVDVRPWQHPLIMEMRMPFFQQMSRALFLFFSHFVTFATTIYDHKVNAAW